MSGRLHGNDPRPWVLVYGVPEESELGAAIGRLFPTVSFVDYETPVRFAEFDALVAVGNTPVGVAGRTHVIQFGGTPVARSRDWYVRLRDGAHARLFSTEGVSEDVVALADATLIPAPGWVYSVLRIDPLVPQPGPKPELEEFAREQGGHPLAGRMRRGADEKAGELWWLPEGTERRDEWVACALRRWQGESPEHFPRAEAWRESDEWTTAPERAARDALDGHGRFAEARVAELLAERDRLAAVLADAQLEADAGERVLLTGQGDALVRSVKAALEELGFRVQDSDELPEHASAKQEDLRITDSDWTCLAEVKGYAKRAAKAGDLLQLGKAVEAYILRESRLPDARWYIVNQLLASPPDERPRPLQGSPDLDAFEATGGLVVDTRDLFRIREAVRRGDLEAEVVRSLLRDARGVFAYPPIEAKS